MDTTIYHFVEYDVERPVLIDDVIASLKANERLLRSASKVLETLVPELTIEVKNFTVPSLSQQSPFKEIIAAAIVLSYQKELQTEVPEIISRLTGISIPDNLDATITVLALIIAVYGINKAYELVFPGRSKAAIEDAEGSLIGQASEILKSPTEEVRRAVEDQFSGRGSRPLLASAQKFFAPARGQHMTTIRAPHSGVILDAETVALAQAAAGLPIDAEDQESPAEFPEFFGDREIVLHAMDRDSRRKGWAGHVPSLFDDRVPMKVDRSIMQEKLFGQEQIRGDILVIFVENEFMERMPKEFILLRTF